MSHLETMNLAWWVAVVEVPAITGLLLLIWRIRRELQESLEAQRARSEGEHGELRDQLAAHKVEVATSYASIPALRDTEGRLIAHLVRIEKKLDSLGFRSIGEAE